MPQTDMERQQTVCERFGATPMPCPLHLKVGIARNVSEGVEPIHALRTKACEETTGWYIWAGEWSDDPDFFVPLHAEHLASWCPNLISYLQLPTGWRVLLAPSYEDIWFDAELASRAINED